MLPSFQRIIAQALCQPLLQSLHVLVCFNVEFPVLLQLD
jgi:hypothetical protein